MRGFYYKDNIFLMLCHKIRQLASRLNVCLQGGKGMCPPISSLRCVLSLPEKCLVVPIQKLYVTLSSARMTGVDVSPADLLRDLRFRFCCKLTCRSCRTTSWATCPTLCTWGVRPSPPTSTPRHCCCSRPPARPSTTSPSDATPSPTPRFVPNLTHL